MFGRIYGAVTQRRVLLSLDICYSYLKGCLGSGCVWNSLLGWGIGLPA